MDRLEEFLRSLHEDLPCFGGGYETVLRENLDLLNKHLRKWGYRFDLVEKDRDVDGGEKTVRLEVGK